MTDPLLEDDDFYTSDNSDLFPPCDRIVNIGTHYTEEQAERVKQRILKNQKIIERVKKVKIDTLAVMSKDNPNHEELQHILFLLEFLLGEEK